MKFHAMEKALIFRIVVVIVDFILLWAIFGNALNAGIGTFSRHAIQVLMYWYHEQVWERHSWGRVDGMESTKRTLVKTVTFRLLTFGKDVFAILFFTSQLSRGLMGVALVTVVNSAIYILFERIWALKKRRIQRRQMAMA